MTKMTLIWKDYEYSWLSNLYYEPSTNHVQTVKYVHKPQLPKYYKHKQNLIKFIHKIANSISLLHLDATKIWHAIIYNVDF